MLYAFTLSGIQPKRDLFPGKMCAGEPLLGSVSHLTCRLIQDTMKLLNLLSLGEWFSHSGPNPHPSCFGSWWDVHSAYAAGTQFLKIFCAYDRTKVMSFKLCALRTDDQVIEDDSILG